MSGLQSIVIRLEKIFVALSFFLLLLGLSMFYFKVFQSCLVA